MRKNRAMDKGRNHSLTTINLKTFWIRSLIVLFIASTVNVCIYPIREAEVLENDVSFIYLNSTEFSEAELEKITSIWKVRGLRGKGNSAEDKNNLGVLFAKNSFLDDAETSWKECMKLSDSNPICFSNLIRMHYLIDEYETAKEEIASYLKNAKKEQVQQVRKLLTSQNRREETVLLLDVQSKIPGMEVVSWEELSTYFLENRITKERISIWKKSFRSIPIIKTRARPWFYWLTIWKNGTIF